MRDSKWVRKQNIFRLDVQLVTGINGNPCIQLYKEYFPDESLSQFSIVTDHKGNTTIIMAVIVLVGVIDDAQDLESDKIFRILELGDYKNPRECHLVRMNTDDIPIFEELKKLSIWKKIW